MKTIVFFFVIMTYCLFSFGQEDYRLKKIIVKYDNGAKNIKEMYHIIRPPLYLTFRPQNRPRHGPYEFYFPNGRISETGEYSYDNKKWYQVFNSSGDIVEEFADSTNIRIKRKYHPRTNIILEEETYKDNIKHGTWKTFDPNIPVSLGPAKVIEYHEDSVISTIINEWKDLIDYSSFILGTKKTTFVEQDSVVHSTLIIPGYLTYPREALEAGVYGNITVEIFEDDNCNLTYELKNSLGYGIDDEVIIHLGKLKEVWPVFKANNELECKFETYVVIFRFVLL